MKKVLALVACLAMFATSSFAQEFSFKNFKLYGEGSIYGFAYENAPENFSGTSGYITLGAMFDVYENITAAFALGYSNLWGDGYVFGGRPINSSNNDDGYLNRITVVEANLNFSNLFGVEGLSAKVGRQYYGDEDSSIIYLGIRRDQPLFTAKGLGNSNVIGAISSIDAFAGYYEKDNIKAKAVYGIFINNSSTSDGNATIMGADATYMNIADMIDIQAYLYDWEDFYGVSNYTILGVKPSFKTGGFKASAEFAKNFAGDAIFDQDISNFIKLDASFELKDIGLTPRAAYVVAGGSDETGYNGFTTMGNYLPGLIIGQLQLSNGWMDNQVINVGADYVMNKFKFSLDFYNYSARDGKTPDDGDGMEYGSELDLIVKYAYTENVDFRAGIGHLFTSEDYADFDSSTLQAGVTYKFK